MFYLRANDQITRVDPISTGSPFVLNFEKSGAISWVIGGALGAAELSQVEVSEFHRTG
jgi:hypothetical protein